MKVSLVAEFRQIAWRLARVAVTLSVLTELASLIPYNRYAGENGLAQCAVTRDLTDESQALCCNGKEISLVCSRGGWPAVFSRTALAAYTLLLCGMFFLALTGRMKSAVWIISGIVAAFAFSHAVKLQFLGEPVYPADFYPHTLRTFASVLSGLALPVQAAFYLSVILLSAPFAAALLFMRREKAALPILPRVLLVLVTTLLFAALMAGKTPFWLYATQLKIAYLNSTQNFFNLGPVGFYLHELPKLQSGDNAGRYAMPVAHSQATMLPRQRPDVFVVLAESLWDPRLLATLKDLPDALPYFRSRLRASGGYLQVPAFGGGTPKTEFEVLTGLSSLDIDGFPYVSAVRRPTRSLASVFARHGYKTVYAHPYKEWMFNRGNAIPRLGFVRVLFEKDIRALARLAPRDDMYFDDASFLDFLCHLPQGADPHFIAAATYGTHGPFPDRPIPPSSLPAAMHMAEKDRRALAKNLALLRRFDDALRAFTDCLGKRARPAMVVVYGDHWPNYSYVDFSLLWGDEPRSHFSRTGYFISGVGYAVPAQALPLTSTNWLHLDILRSAGIAPDFVARELHEIREALPVLGVYKEFSGQLVRNLPQTVPTTAAQTRYRELASAVLHLGFGLSD